VIRIRNKLFLITGNFKFIKTQFQTKRDKSTEKFGFQ